jgi:hypothetical protein
MEESVISNPFLFCMFFLSLVGLAKRLVVPLSSLFWAIVVNYP